MVMTPSTFSFLSHTNGGEMKGEARGGSLGEVAEAGGGILWITLQMTKHLANLAFWRILER
jgi:hypothetical protein